MADAASASAFTSGSDALGVYVRVSVDPKVYSETAVLKTAYWFTDQYYLYLASNRDTGFLELELRLKQGESLDQLKAASGQFWNKLLDQEVRQRVLEETSPIREQLLKKAFFEAKAPLPSGIVSNEASVPKSDQNYLDDPIGAGHQD